MERSAQDPREGVAEPGGKGAPGPGPRPARLLPVCCFRPRAPHPVITAPLTPEAAGREEMCPRPQTEGGRARRQRCTGAWTQASPAPACRLLPASGSTPAACTDLASSASSLLTDECAPRPSPSRNTPTAQRGPRAASGRALCPGSHWLTPVAMDPIRLVETPRRTGPRPAPPGPGFLH